jgi:hypothetical protein
VILCLRLTFDRLQSIASRLRSLPDAPKDGIGLLPIKPRQLTILVDGSPAAV